MHALDESISDGVKFKPKHFQGVLVESMDAFVGSPEIMVPNHVKIDVDELEKMIVANMKCILGDRRLRSIMIEVEVELSDGQIEQTIESFGFVERLRERMAGREIYKILYQR